MFERFKLEKRITVLEDEIKKLQREWLDRDMDWTELRARCKRLLDRTEKAAARVVESETSAANGGEGEDGSSSEGTQSASGLFLTPHQREIQQKILRRRGGVS